MAITALATILFEVGSVVLITICVLFRFYSALRNGGCQSRSKAGKASDVFLILAWLFMSVSAGCALIRAGMQHTNLHSDDPLLMPTIGLTIEELPMGLKTLATETITYITSWWLVKAALVAMMFEIKPSLRPTLRTLLHLTASFTLAAYLTLLILSFTICIPFSANWTLNPALFCSNVKVSTLTTAAILSIINDAMIFSIPILLVWSLHIPPLASLLTFLFLLISISLNIARAAITSHYSTSDSLAVAFSIDSLGRIEIISMVQLGFAFFTACIPQIRMFFGSGEDKKKRDEILGLLPREVGELVIVKTLEVRVMVEEVEIRGYRGLESAGSGTSFEEWK